MGDAVFPERDSCQRPDASRERPAREEASNIPASNGNVTPTLAASWQILRAHGQDGGVLVAGR
jgi:hypothetical protein